MGIGLVSAHRAARRRSGRDPLLLGGRAEPRRLGVPDEHRSILAGRPSLGAWVTYGLGSGNRNLPSFVVLIDDEEVLGGPKNWSARLPARDVSGHAVPPGRYADSCT